MGVRFPSSAPNRLLSQGEVFIILIENIYTVKITKTDIDALNAVLNVDLTQEDYLSKVNNALAKARKNIAMNGFRKGMVPLGLVKKMYGTGVMVEEINKAINEETNKFIQENKIEILGQPMPKSNDLEFDINEPKDYHVEFELGLAPKFELSALDSKTVVKAPKVIIDDELLNKELDNMRVRYGKMQFPEDGIQDSDVLQIKFEELLDDQIKESGVVATSPIRLDIVKNKTLKKALQDGKVGTTVVAKNLFTSLDREPEQIEKHILGLKETPENLEKSFNMTIERISRMEKSELDQEFFDKAFGPGKVTNEQEAKEKLSADLSEYLSQSESGKLNERIYNLLLDQTDIALPDAFLKRWIKFSNEKPITDEILEEEYPQFAKNLKWSLIVNKISQENDLKGDFEEVKEHSKNLLRRQLLQYAPSGEGFSDDDLEMLNNSMLQKEDHVKKSYDAVMEQKLFNVIKQKITVEEETVSFDDFFKS